MMRRGVAEEVALSKLIGAEQPIRGVSRFNIDMPSPRGAKAPSLDDYKIGKDDESNLIRMMAEEDAAAGKPIGDIAQYGYAASDLLSGKDMGDQGREMIRRFQMWKKRNRL